MTPCSKVNGETIIGILTWGQRERTDTRESRPTSTYLPTSPNSRYLPSFHSWSEAAEAACGMAPFCPQRDLALHSHGEDVISPLGCANSSEPRTEFSDRRRRRNVDTLPPTTSTACNPNEEKYFTFPMTMDSIWRRYGGTVGGKRANANPKGSLQKPPTLLILASQVNQSVLWEASRV